MINVIANYSLFYIFLAYKKFTKMSKYVTIYEIGEDMKSSIKKKHWIVFGVTAVVYLIWAITVGTMINFSDRLGVNSDQLNQIYKVFATIFIQGTLYSTVFVVFFFAPNLKIFNKNLNSRIEDKIIEMRRNTCLSASLCLVVGFFGLCMMNVSYIINPDFWTIKIGPRELFGIIAIGGVAASLATYFIKAKKLIEIDYLANKNDAIIAQSATDLVEDKVDGVENADA